MFLYWKDIPICLRYILIMSILNNSKYLLVAPVVYSLHDLVPSESNHPYDESTRICYSDALNYLYILRPCMDTLGIIGMLNFLIDIIFVRRTYGVWFIYKVGLFACFEAPWKLTTSLYGRHENISVHIYVNALFLSSNFQIIRTFENVWSISSSRVCNTSN